MGNAYDVRDIDLTLAADRRQLVARDTGVSSITVLEIPPGTVFSLHLGQRQAIPVAEQGFRLDNICPPEMDGVFMTFPPQPGVIVRVYLGFGSLAAVLE